MGAYEQRCEIFGCQDTYFSARGCQCNEACTRYANCCFDYQAICRKPSTSAPASTASPSLRTTASTASPSLRRTSLESEAGVNRRADAVAAGVTTTTTTASATAYTAGSLPSLFCFVVVRTQGYEPDLIRAQESTHVGIFQCDESAVLSNGGPLRIGAGMAIEVPAQGATMGDMSVAGTTTNSWLNAQVFMKAWDMISQDGRWWTHDWTVKADPDAVVFPDRLRLQLMVRAPRGSKVPQYIANCDRSWHGMAPSLKLFGAVEILSRDAVGTYKAYSKRCRRQLPWHGWGEDMFMQTCLNILGAKPVNGTHMVADKRCYATPCSDSSKVAFHDFKTVASFMQCWFESRNHETVSLVEK